MAASQEPLVPEPDRPAGQPSRLARSLRRAGGSAAARMPSPPVLRIAGLWLAWLAIVCAFQIVVAARLAPARPDNTLTWTQYETATAVLDCRPMLADSSMNEHVAFDSEYYVSIATSGYDDPNAQAYAGGTGFQRWNGVPSCAQGAPEDWTSLNYAFLPGYPMAMRPFIALEGVLPFTSDLTDTGKATLAGIVVAALGALLAMLALARLMAFYARRRHPGDPDAGAWGGPTGIRAALFLLIFPTGFYLAQVYTEGLFVGLAFMACALAVERKIAAAAVFAVLATWVRPAGMFLFFPIAWAVFEAARERWRAGGLGRKDWRLGAAAIGAVAPVAAFAAWYVSPLGQKFQTVEDEYFSRRFDLVGAWNTWTSVADSLVSGVDKTGSPSGYQYFGGSTLQSSSSVYIALELLALGLAVVATIWLLRRMPGVALFGLGVLVLSFGSSAVAPQGMDRYVIAMPAIFMMLAWWGRRVVFDRAWSLASTMLMAMSAMLFTFGFWVS